MHPATKGSERIRRGKVRIVDQPSPLQLAIQERTLSAADHRLQFELLHVFLFLQPSE